MINLLSLREAQARWTAVPLARRLRMVRTLRGLIGTEAGSLAQASADARGRPMAESLTAEVLPLAEACRFLERNAVGILSKRSFGRGGRPLWLGGVHSEIHREAYGVILIIGPGNYPLFLPGVQWIQALVAGNAVILKPGVGGGAAAARLHDLVLRAGFDADLIEILPESVEAANAAIDAGPDKVVFTGSAEIARKVLARLAPKMIPAVIEASGCDAVIVRQDADPELVERAVAFALTLNGGATCMVPQRLYVHREIADDIQQRLDDRISVRRYASDDEAVALANDGEFGLGVSIFTRDETGARDMAKRLSVGLVTINDIIVSSADPRLPFGGRRQSGFGTTRGAEGLLEMAATKSLTISRNRFRPAYDAITPRTLSWILSYSRLAHAAGFRRLRIIKSS